MMRPNRFFLFPAVLLAIVLASCAPGPQPVPPAAPTEALTGTEVAVETAAAAEAVAAPGAVPGPRDLPPMEVGSTFLYIDGNPLVAVPGGPFIMGNGRPDAPERTVVLDDFWIQQFEVTNRMYGLCVAAGECTPPDAQDNPAFTDVRQGNKPVVGVNWPQAGEYCEFVHGRHPTEAEWEKAARGPDGNTYPWGEEAPACSLVNFDGCLRKTAFVGSFPDGASYYLAMDMSGNVAEWVADWYLAGYPGTAPTQNPTGPEAGTERSVRSTAFNADGFLTEAARRFSEKPQAHRADLGFRCVIEDPAYFAPFCTQLLVYGSDAGGGSGSGESLAENCTEPALELALLTCTQTNVWVDGNGDLSSLTGLEGCLDGGMQMHNGELQHLYTCSPGTPAVQACGTCEYPLPSGGASCPDGYHQAGLQCVVDQGFPGVCPPGSEYDESLMCCSVTTGGGAAYDLCPPGYSYVPGGSPDDPGSCVDYVAGDIKCAPLTVDFKQGCGGDQPDCEEHPEDPRCGPGSCNPQTDPNCPPPGGACPPTNPNCG